MTDTTEKVPCTCGASLVVPWPNDTGSHSTTECIDVETDSVIPATLRLCQHLVLDASVCPHDGCKAAPRFTPPAKPEATS